MKKATKPHSKTVKDTRSAYRVRANRTGRAGKAVKKIDLAIPESVFESSRQLAQKLGMPLSEFYTAALAAYISAHQAASVTDQLNRVYATESSELDPALVQVQVALLAGESW